MSKKQHPETWAVYKNYYMTTEEIQQYGDKPRELVTRGLTFEAARLLVESKGYDHSMHQESSCT